MARIHRLLLSLTILLVVALGSTDGFFRWHFGHGRHGGHHGLTFHKLARTVMNHGFRENAGRSAHKGEDEFWKRHNICRNISHSESPENKRGSFFHRLTECDWINETVTCTLTKGRKQISIDFNCCPGTKRSKEDLSCVPVTTEKLLKVAEVNGLTQFVRAVETVGLARKLENGNFTIFAPGNDAFGLDSDFLGNNGGIVLQGDDVRSVDTAGIDRTIANFQNALLSHVIPEVRESREFQDEEVVKTLSPEESTVRINFFRRPSLHDKFMTANCVPVTKKDMEATNGIVFAVEKHLDAVTKSLLELVRTRPELSTLKTLLASANLVSKLKQDGQLTLLAPTNAAFDRVSPGLRKKLLNGNEEFIERVIQNHLLPNVICSSAVEGKARTKNALESELYLERTEDDKLFVDGAQVIKADIMGTNGVIHIIDKALIPDEALDVMDLLEKNNYTEFLSLINAAGLTKTFQRLEDVTIFAPTNQAIQELPVAVRTKLETDEDFLREVLLYHVADDAGVDGAVGVFSRDQALFPSRAGKKIRITYNDNPFISGLMFKKTKSSAQCVPVQDKVIRARDAKILTLEGVMFPPQGTVLDILSSDKRFSRFYGLLKKSGAAELLSSEDFQDTPFTIFAPNNEAFEKVDQETLLQKEADIERLKHALLRQIIYGFDCYGDYDVTRSTVQFGHTVNRNLYVIIFHSDSMYFDRARITRPDRTASNGNVVEIDYPMMFEY